VLFSNWIRNGKERVKCKMMTLRMWGSQLNTFGYSQAPRSKSPEDSKKKRVDLFLAEADAAVAPKVSAPLVRERPCWRSEEKDTFVGSDRKRQSPDVLLILLSKQPFED
jgi:hypothetical protein